jgi:hypothetical protein
MSTIFHLVVKVLECTVIFANDNKEMVDNDSEAIKNAAEDTGPSVEPISLLYYEQLQRS